MDMNSVRRPFTSPKLSGGFAAPRLVGKSSCVARRPISTPRRSFKVSAQKATNDTLQRGVERFLQKYDITSAGVGALTVTSYCVWRGQDPLTALSITLAATVAALVINEYVFEERR